MRAENAQSLEILIKHALLEDVKQFSVSEMYWNVHKGDKDETGNVL